MSWRFGIFRFLEFFLGKTVKMRFSFFGFKGVFGGIKST